MLLTFTTSLWRILRFSRSAPVYLELSLFQVENCLEISAVHNWILHCLVPSTFYLVIITEWHSGRGRQCIMRLMMAECTNQENRAQISNFHSGHSIWSLNVARTEVHPLYLSMLVSCRHQCQLLQQIVSILSRRWRWRTVLKTRSIWIQFWFKRGTFTTVMTVATSADAL